MSKLKKFVIRVFSFVLWTMMSHSILAQDRMRPVDQLINKDDPGWVLVKKWIDSATNKVEILPVDINKAKEALFETQVTTRSPMGAIVFMTGGILVDDGWIRILGSGSAKLNRTLPGWNLGKSFENFGEKPGFLLVADDAVGGFFLLNGGALGTDLGKLYYFAPDNLEYTQLDVTYTQFLFFCFNNDLDKFYKGMRWKNWRAEVSKLSGDQVYNFVPFLWTKEGKNIDKDSRTVIPIEEQYQANIDFRRQLGLYK